jgi:hypothetical protein
MGALMTGTLVRLRRQQRKGHDAGNYIGQFQGSFGSSFAFAGDHHFG